MHLLSAVPPLLAPHHDPSERWLSNPNPSPGDVIVVELEVPDDGIAVDEAWLRLVRDGEGELVAGQAHRTNTATRWKFEMPCDNEIVNYRFWLGGPDGALWLTAAGLIDHDPTDHHDFRVMTTGGAPDWVHRTVWYQIFPDRFAASTEGDRPALPDWAQPAAWTARVVDGPDAMTQLYGGDLDGIVEHLDHLVDLGVSGIYLTPIFPARSNHRYDATSFDRVDPLLGGDRALVRLREACDLVGIRLLCDITLNHTGDAHDWFLAAQSDPDAVERGFYYFDDSTAGYMSWLGVPSLPKLDHASEELAARLHDGADSVLGRFLAEPFRIDGWRVDVANMTGRLGPVDHNRSVRRAARATVDEVGDDAWLVGENFFDPSGDVEGPGWHGWMNYIGVSRPILSWLARTEVLRSMSPGPGQDARSGTQVARAIDEARAAVPWSYLLGSMSLLGSHDTARWRTAARSAELAMVGLGMMMTMPGSPCFLYGDEIAMTGEDNEKSRAPMPWHAREAWDLDTLGQYRALTSFRRQSAALATGGFRWVERSDDSLAYLRETKEERLLIRATRAAAEGLEVPARHLGLEVEPRQGLTFGDVALAVSPSHLTLDSPGPSFTIVRLDPSEPAGADD